MRKGIIELEMRQGTYRGPEKGISETRKERILAFQENQLAWKGRELYRLYWAEVVSVSPFVVNIGGKTMELSPQSYAWINPPSLLHISEPTRLLSISYAVFCLKKTKLTSKL